MGKKSAAQAAVVEAIALRHFPPSLKYPELGSGMLLSEWFAYPTLTWAPECLEPNRKPKCVVDGCSCSPKVKAYKQRIVEDVEHKTVLYYARYQCTGATKTSFSTISDLYLSSSKKLVLNFPYMLSYKTGISSDMFDIVYDGMLSTKGISGAVANILRRRQTRYYRILASVGAKVEDLRLENRRYEPPLPPLEAQYMSSHSCLDAEGLRDLWLTHTDILSRLCAAQMLDTKCQRVIRLDHSQKFCSKLKVYGANCSKEQSSSIRMLLLVQNEVGQIMGRALTKSENHDETEALLQSMISKMSGESGAPRICVSDNANANRNLVKRVFGDAVEIKQDPFHVITRFTEKLGDSAKKRWLATQLSAAIYDVQRNLRSPEECEKRMAAVLHGLDLKWISAKRSEWEGCVASNLAQVRIGDLYVDENNYIEAGGEVRIVSTSQLEAIHSKLRKLLDRIVSVDVGLRILDIFILQHNLNTGAKHKRNPEFHGTDFRTICQTAVMCNGLLPESPQIEYMRHLMMTKASELVPSSSYRASTVSPGEHRPWEKLFHMIQLRTSSVEARLLGHDTHTDDIRLLLTNSFNKSRGMSRERFIDLLRLEPEYDSAREFSSHEFSLLKQLRAEQLAAKKVWSDCAAVATILYNCAVDRLDNRALNVRKRGFRVITKRLPGIDEQIKKDPPLSGQRILIMTDKPICDDTVTPDEDALMRNLFDLVRISSLTKRKQVYATVYSFAAAACDEISPKSKALLLRRWEGLKRTHNRGKKRETNRPDEDPPAPDCLQPVISSFSEDSDRPLDKSKAQPFATAAEKIPASNSMYSAEVNCVEVAACARKSFAAPSLARMLTSTPIADAVVAPAAQNLPASAYLLRWDPDTEAHLRNIDAQMGKHCKGKWQFIYQEYRKRYPESDMRQNAIRMRLRDRADPHRSATMVDQHPVVAAEASSTQQNAQSTKEDPPATSKRSLPACDSCRSRKRRCGPSSDNEQCKHRQPTHTNTIASFFS